MSKYILHFGDINRINEAVKNKSERNLLYAVQKLEELDEFTGTYFSNYDELRLAAMQNEEVKKYISRFENPKLGAVIMSLTNEGVCKVATSDIVFTEDKKQIDNRDNLKLWAMEYLKKYPEHIMFFEGLYSTFSNIYGYNVPKTEDKVENTVRIYFNKPTYADYREVYFELKYLDPPKVAKTNETYR